MSEQNTPSPDQSAESAAPTAETVPAPAAEASGGGTADLGSLIEGKSDDEILAKVRDLGEEGLFSDIFNEMAKRFLPDKAVGRVAVIQYDINLPDGTKTYQVDIVEGTCTAGQGAAKEPSVVLTLSGPDFLRLISGKLNGVTAFMSGKLKIKGDMMLAQTMQGWFEQG